MAMPLRVEHPEHGRGTVARLLDGGRRLLVRFDGSPVLRVLRSVEATQAEKREDADEPVAEKKPKAVRGPAAAQERRVPKKPQVAKEDSAAKKRAPVRVSVAATADSEVVPVAAPPSKAQDARQALEALRTGVVPASGLGRITVGRQRELAQVDRMLEQGSGMAVVSGGYGQGKTHMLELAAARALGNGWLVAHATFDPVEVPPSHPLRLYAALIRGLSYPDQAGRGLRPLLERLGDSGRHVRGSARHRWLSPALFAVHHTESALADEVLEFVSGQHRPDYADLLARLHRLGYRGERAYALADWRTFGQIMAHLLGGIAAWARDAGYGGLLVLLDEAEYLDQLCATSRTMANNVLRYLAMATLPPEDLAFDPETVYRGGHAAHRQIPARFRRDQPLAVMSAFTPNPGLERVLGDLLADGEHRIDLAPIAGSDLLELADGVSSLVAAAYPDFRPTRELHRQVRDAVGDAHSLGEIDDPRQAARMATELWDIHRHAVAKGASGAP